MSNYLGDGFSKMMGQLFVVALLVLVIVIVCVFFLGRCTAKRGVEFQSPVKVTESK